MKRIESRNPPPKFSVTKQINSSKENLISNSDLNRKGSRNYTVYFVNIKGEQIELLKNVKIKQAIAYDNGNQAYKDETNKWYSIKNNNK